jgi:hypothetical protein
VGHPSTLVSRGGDDWCRGRVMTFEQIPRPTFAVHPARVGTTTQSHHCSAIPLLSLFFSCNQLSSVCRRRWNMWIPLAFQGQHLGS